ncbi:hypothetical protein SKAU_G00275940 [Synaphobranchus kaupii]|uniref:Ig-like domain-containing protein n=1 Tax=Synaphobranchus kaupii TaxID=118154 RepID=A0A9Q1IQ64_SYNKA|nr:hypothetical protein SKAU_G00275940 [Synaphobranchus kaupii]
MGHTEPKWRPLYHGETVTLKCEVDPYSNWTYFWYTEQQHRATSLTKEYNVTISGAAGSDQGQYWCEGRLEGRNVTSLHSDSITLTVADGEFLLPPQPPLQLHHPLLSHLPGLIEP